MEFDASKNLALSHFCKLREQLTFAVLANPNHTPGKCCTNDIVVELLKGIIAEYGFNKEKENEIITTTEKQC